MDKELAKTLLPLVNDPQLWPLVVSFLETRVEDYRGYLERSQSFDERNRGAIAELRYLLTLRERVNKEVR